MEMANFPGTASGGSELKSGKLTLMKPMFITSFLMLQRYKTINCCDVKGIHGVARESHEESEQARSTRDSCSGWTTLGQRLGRFQERS